MDGWKKRNKPRRSRRAIAGAFIIGLITMDIFGVTPAADAVIPNNISNVAADAETTPVTSSGDSADDPAIWVHPTDPSRSLVIGNDKGTALEVYDLSGKRIQLISGGHGNVDVRRGFPLRSSTVEIAAASRSGIRIYRIDPATRQLSNITDGGTITGASGEGFCLYRSPVSGRFYGFLVNREGRVQQVELADRDSDGLIDGQLVRTFNVGSEAEGCVADDGLGHLYVSEEKVGIWRYGAEPSASSNRVLVDSVGAGGNLVADVEGLTIVYQPDGTGYLIASAQNVASPTNNYYAVYQRQSGNAFVGAFRVVAGTSADGCARTDGIDAMAAPLGPNFPSGLFVCQDHQNTTPGTSGNQNFKFVRLEKIVSLVPPDGEPPPPPPPDVSFVPVADARVTTERPDTNFGASTVLEADNAPYTVQSFLRFTVTNVTAPVTSVRLRLYVTNASANGPEVHRSSTNDWSESGITWNNKPSPTGSLLADIGSVPSGQYVEWSLPTTAVPGNGTYSFILIADSDDGTDFHSREAANPPRLILEFD